MTDESARQALQERQRDLCLPGVIELPQGSAGRGEAPGQPGAAE